MTPAFVTTSLKMIEEWNNYQRQTAERSYRWLETKIRPPDKAALQLAPTAAETVYRLNKIRLLHYPNPERDPDLATPLLLVPSIINKYYIMDLQPGRSMELTSCPLLFATNYFSASLPRILMQPLRLCVKFS